MNEGTFVKDFLESVSLSFSLFFISLGGGGEDCVK